MLVKARLLVLAVAVGLSSAALSGCGGGMGKAQPSAPKALPVPSMVVDASQAMSATVNAATSVHVKGTYRWPNAKLGVDIGLLMSGQMAGLMVDDGVPMSIIVVGRNMYAKVTSAFLAHLGKSGECAALCGKYVIIRGAMAAGLMRGIGGTTTVNILLGMAAPKSALTAATFHGHPAYR
jgi:hypothetical protein